LVLLFLFNIVLEASAIRQETEIIDPKEIIDLKKEKHVGDMIVHIQTTRDLKKETKNKRRKEEGQKEIPGTNNK
jgi:hypothetical protein